MRRQKSLRNGVHHADGVVWGPVYRTHLIFAMQLREFVMTPSNSPDAARTATAHAKERTHPNAAVRSIVANALRSIVARNPALSPAMPHGYDEMAENAGFAAMTTPARSDASASSLAPQNLHMNTAVENMYVVLSMETMDSACTPKTQYQSSGVAVELRALFPTRFLTEPTRRTTPPTPRAKPRHDSLRRMCDSDFARERSMAGERRRDGRRRSVMPTARRRNAKAWGRRRRGVAFVVVVAVVVARRPG